ncbi:tyrosine-type recombinase/integrase [Archangium violaceum]|uniref:tyrosine-type recombinase/integrase n=1 Tax=Archangium violaceum TaxID=83451 RepID=UPI0037BF937E
MHGLRRRVLAYGTGLRVGKLRRLERDCVREDHTGTRYLKVPLGKLHNERLVPLDAAALAAVTELQARARAESRWLVESVRQGRPVSAHTYQATRSDPSSRASRSAPTGSCRQTTLRRAASARSPHR